MTSAGTPRWLALLGIVLALALPAVLMACGSDAPDADGERAATPRTEAASTPATEAAASTPMPGDAPTATAAPRPTATTAPLLTIGRTSAKTDREALVVLYNATDGPNWNRRSNWLSDAPLGEWVGVYTDDAGRVTELSLGLLLGRFLSGNRLSGEIPAELGSLANLRVLQLDGNRLNGEIPAELGSLANLERLNLSSTWLSGEIPAELGSLANLESLVLDDSGLSGEIPPELGSLANLELLNLSQNQLSGCAPASLRRDGLRVYLLQLDMTLYDIGDLPFC